MRFLGRSISSEVVTERYLELQRVVDEHCPVLDVFKNPVPVSVNVLVSGR